MIYVYVYMAIYFQSSRFSSSLFSWSPSQLIFSPFHRQNGHICSGEPAGYNWLRCTAAHLRSSWIGPEAVWKRNMGLTPNRIEEGSWYAQHWVLLKMKFWWVQFSDLLRKHIVSRHENTIRKSKPLYHWNVHRREPKVSKVATGQSSCLPTRTGTVNLGHILKGPKWSPHEMFQILKFWFLVPSANQLDIEKWSCLNILEIRQTKRLIFYFSM